MREKAEGRERQSTDQGENELRRERSLVQAELHLRAIEVSGDSDVHSSYQLLPAFLLAAHVISNENEPCARAHHRLAARDEGACTSSAGL